MPGKPTLGNGPVFFASMSSSVVPLCARTSFVASNSWDDGKRLLACEMRLELHVRTKSKNRRSVEEDGPGRRGGRADFGPPWVPKRLFFMMFFSSPFRSRFLVSRDGF